VDGGHLDFRFGKSHVVMDVEEATPGRKACNRGWDRNLLESLKHYVETGRGEPYPQWRADLTP
jgi:hypothetical protein